MRVPAKHIHAQLVSVLGAWGMSDAHAETTAEMMVETDLRGVETHGVSNMLRAYARDDKADKLDPGRARK